MLAIRRPLRASSVLDGLFHFLLLPSLLPSPFFLLPSPRITSQARRLHLQTSRRSTPASPTATFACAHASLIQSCIIIHHLSTKTAWSLRPPGIDVSNSSFIGAPARLLRRPQAATGGITFCPLKPGNPRNVSQTPQISMIWTTPQQIMGEGIFRQPEMSAILLLGRTRGSPPLPPSLNPQS